MRASEGTTFEFRTPLRRLAVDRAGASEPTPNGCSDATCSTDCICVDRACFSLVLTVASR